MLSTALSTGLLVLALAAAAYALMLALRADAASERLYTLAANLESLAKVVDRSQSAKLVAQVDDIVLAMETDRRAMRRELGKLWGRLGHAPEFQTGVDEESTPDEIKAFLELQNAHRSN